MNSFRRPSEDGDTDILDMRWGEEFSVNNMSAVQISICTGKSIHSM